MTGHTPRPYALPPPPDKPPPPEVMGHEVDPDTALPSGRRSGVSVTARLARDQGWKVVVTHSRGPYIGADGTVLRTADCWVVRAKRGPKRAVAGWIAGSNGKAGFAFAFGNGVGERLTIEELKARLREAP